VVVVLLGLQFLAVLLVLVELVAVEMVAVIPLLLEQ
jgi:hypothetical protein